MKPEPAAANPTTESSESFESSESSESSARPSAPRVRLPGQITTKKMLLAMAVVYGVWLAWMAYVAWVNVKSGNP